MVSTFYQLAFSTLLLFSPFMYADQASYEFREELLAFASEIEARKEDILKEHEPSVCLEELAFPLFKKQAPRFLEMVDRLIEKSGLHCALALCLTFDGDMGAAMAREEGTLYEIIFITKQCIELLNDQEIEAVIAHEIGHIALDHIKSMNTLRENLASKGAFCIETALVSSLNGIFLTQTIFRRELPVTVPGIISAGIASFICVCMNRPLVQKIKHALVCKNSRNHEYEADAFSANLTKNPAALAEALKKLPDPQSSSFIRKNWDLISRTHPYTKDRIAALEQIAASFDTSLRDTQDERGLVAQKEAAVAP